MLPEELCKRLSVLADQESRTVSNMAKVLIQQGVKLYESKNSPDPSHVSSGVATEKFRSALEAQQTRRLRGAPRRFRLYRPS